MAPGLHNIVDGCGGWMELKARREGAGGRSKAWRTKFHKIWKTYHILVQVYVTIWCTLMMERIRVPASTVL